MKTAVAADTGRRIGSLDAWRGLIIVVMALDHANGFIARGKLAPEMWGGPYPDYGGDWLAFMTRWVTHAAAPGFFFLLGVGAVLFARARRRAGWSQRRVTIHLLVRGALLIVLQFTLENAAWEFGDSLGGFTYIGVLYALGASLVVAALAFRLSGWVLALAGAGVLVATELVLPEFYRQFATWRLFVTTPGPGDGWYSLYPALPWLGVAALGMAFGRWLGADRDRALKSMLPLGLVALAGFVVLRAADGFGNVRERQTDDLIGFLNVVKYPPAITFSLPSVSGSAIAGVLRTYGAVPLFFYLAHLWLYAQMGLWIDRSGTGIPVMYFWWFAGLAALYPACWAYGRFKQSRPPASLWRFF